VPETTRLTVTTGSSGGPWAPALFTLLARGSAARVEPGGGFVKEQQVGVTTMLTAMSGAASTPE
jgi:hypothetical protein